MRISGLASGIDTESIINDMMRAHRLPLNKITQKKQYLEWQLDDYRSVNRDIRSMRDDLYQMTIPSTYMAKTVKVSNENAVGIRALSATSEFAGTIEVDRLAKAATWQGGRKIDTKDGNIENQNIPQDKSINEIFDGLEVGSKIKITAANGTDSDEIVIEENESIKTLVDKINKSDAGVTAFYDSHTGRIAMTAKESGAGSIKVEFINEDGTPLVFDAQEVDITEQKGQNAKIKFNGLETERSSNTFEVNGFEITLKETTNSPVTFNSTPDVDKVFDAVKKFVDDYNNLIKDLNVKVRETKYRDFHPLSAEEKAEMKEKEIELWEEKAMSGTLRNDPTIQSLLQNMRLVLSGSVKEPIDSETGMILAEIGITTSDDYLANGMLVIDEERLREVISTEPNKVYELLGRTGSETNSPGLIHELRTAMKNANDAIASRAGSSGTASDSFTIGRNIKEMDKQIERFQERMKQIEERYWKQFAAMERAMQRANAQAQQLMNALGGMM